MVDTLEKLGKLITQDEGVDAVHIAVAPVISGANWLSPAQPLVFTYGSQEEVTVPVDYTKAIGIVDPYLKNPVHKGQRFWMFLYPASITGLRHVWTHPAFDEQTRSIAGVEEYRAAKEWITLFAARFGWSYDTMLAQGKLHALTGSGLHGGDEVDRAKDRSIPNEFWDHIETLTGVKAPARHRDTWFRCAC